MLPTYWLAALAVSVCSTDAINITPTADDYSSLIASVGQALAQVPQDMHFSASIT